MEYRLLYDTGNGYEDLDLGDEAPAMNYQIANLNELKDRQAAYSQAIKLPKTSNNLRILGFLDSMVVVAEAAYTPRRCKLLCEGAQISPAGAVLYVDSIDDYAGGFIECQIVSSTVDLFSILGNVDNEQMGNDAWQGLWTSDRILSDNADENGAKRWPAIFPLQGQTQVQEKMFPSGGVEVYHMVPCYRFTTMIEELFRLYGYRIESDIFDDPYMKSLYITASKITADSDVTVSYQGKRTNVPLWGNNDEVPGSVDLESVSQVETLGGNEKVDSDSPLRPKWNQWRYYAAQPGDYKLEINIRNVGSFSLNEPNRLLVKAYATRGVGENSNGKEQEIKNQANPTVAPGESWKVEVEVTDLNPMDYIGFQILVYHDRLLAEMTYIDVTAQVSLIHEDAAPGIGSPFDFAQATGFKNYKELVQAFMQLFGVLVDVIPASAGSSDGSSGTVRMYTFQEIYRRRDAGQYVDWSDKLVIDNERNIGFTVGNYAQNNIIQLTDNTDDGTHDAGSFKIRNRTLQSEKALFTIAVEAGRDLTTGVYDQEIGEFRTVAVVPTFDPETETDDEGVTTTTSIYKGCKAHLVRITDKTYVTRITTGYYEGTPRQAFFPQALTVPMQELVDRYYAPVKRLMSNARTISAYFNLHALDIDQLDLFTPVWIKPYGCFFYISKINNFIAGQPTKVELVKMSSYEDQSEYYLTLRGGNEDVSTTAPVETTNLRIPYRTNGTLQITHSGSAIANVRAENGYIVVQTVTNDTYKSRVGTVALSIKEAPSIVRQITVTQEGMALPYEVTLTLTTDGTDLYVRTSRPLAAGERVKILSRGCGRCRNQLGAPNLAEHHRSRKRWHVPHEDLAYPPKFPIDANGKIGGLGEIGKWRLEIDDKNGQKYCHVYKANWSHGFGYKAVEGLNKAVMFAVCIYRGGIQLSNRCYFESRCHIRNGALEQEFVTPE